MNKTIYITVEIPKGSRNKYEYDPHLGAFKLDRRLFSATSYPADYGFIPNTLAEDGDPLDVLVLMQDPTFTGCMINVRPLGVLWMKDEKGPDAKIICVPASDRDWDGTDHIDQVPNGLLREIKHFFTIYKDLEPDKSSLTDTYEGPNEAWNEIHASLDRYPA